MSCVVALINRHLTRSKYQVIYTAETQYFRFRLQRTGFITWIP